MFTYYSSGFVVLAGSFLGIMASVNAPASPSPESIPGDITYNIPENNELVVVEPDTVENCRESLHLEQEKLEEYKEDTSFIKTSDQ